MCSNIQSPWGRGSMGFTVQRHHLSTERSVMLLGFQHYLPASLSTNKSALMDQPTSTADDPSIIDARKIFGRLEAPSTNHSPSDVHSDSFTVFPIELMSRVFELSDKKSCAAAAVVCRRWSNSGLDELWRSLPSLVPLLSLLGPLEDTDIGKDLHPDVIVADSTWEVFKSYARRVRVLEHDDSPDGCVSTGLVLRIVSSHLGQTILPNLREARWNLRSQDTTHQVPVLSSPSLENLSIQVDGIDVRMTQRMLVSLSSFPLPHLRTFHLLTENARGVDSLFNKALSKFIKHRETLSELRLQAIQITPDGGILQAAYGFSQLRVFEGDLVGFTGTNFRSALEGLASSCPCLEVIALSKGGLDSEDIGEPLTFADVEPLLRCRRLADVRVWGDTLRPFEEENIRLIGQAWPRLTTLIIGTRAEPATEFGTPFFRLMEFAQYLPTIQRLACRFRCSEHIPTADQVTARFKQLCVLGFEESTIPSESLTSVAEFLAMVCGPEVKFTSSENSWFTDRAFLDREGFSEPDEWNQVETIIRAIHRAQVGYSNLKLGPGNI